MVRRRPSSTRAARARSEESDRDPIDGSSPAECGVTDRRAFVRFRRTQTHNNSEKLHCFFLCFSMCYFSIFSGEWHTRAGPFSRARAVSTRRGDARRTVDGSEETVGRRRFFFLRRPPSFVRHEGPPIVRSRRARARARARRPARESPARRRRRATGRDGGDREVRARFPETDRGGERGGGRARARGGEATSARTRGDDWHGGVSDDGGARGADSDVARRANV